MKKFIQIMRKVKSLGHGRFLSYLLVCKYFQTLESGSDVKLCDIFIVFADDERFLDDDF